MSDPAWKIEHTSIQTSSALELRPRERLSASGLCWTSFAARCWCNMSVFFNKLAAPDLRKLHRSRSQYSVGAVGLVIVQKRARIQSNFAACVRCRCFSSRSFGNTAQTLMLWTIAVSRPKAPMFSKASLESLPLHQVAWPPDTSSIASFAFILRSWQPHGLHHSRQCFVWVYSASTLLSSPGHVETMLFQPSLALLRPARHCLACACV